MYKCIRVYECVCACACACMCYVCIYNTELFEKNFFLVKLNKLYDKSDAHCKMHNNNKFSVICIPTLVLTSKPPSKKALR